MSSLTRDAFKKKEHEPLRTKLNKYAADNKLPYANTSALLDRVKKEIKDNTPYGMEMKKIFEDLDYNMYTEREGLYIKKGDLPKEKLPPSAKADVHVDSTKFPSQEQRPAIALPPPDYVGDQESYDIDDDTYRKNSVQFYKNLADDVEIEKEKLLKEIAESKRKEEELARKVLELEQKNAMQQQDIQILTEHTRKLVEGDGTDSQYSDSRFGSAIGETPVQGEQGEPVEASVDQPVEQSESLLEMAKRKLGFGKKSRR